MSDSSIIMPNSFISTLLNTTTLLMCHSGGSIAPLAQGTFQLFTKSMFRKEKNPHNQKKKKKRTNLSLRRLVNETEFNSNCRPYSKARPPQVIAVISSRRVQIAFKISLIQPKCLTMISFPSLSDLKKIYSKLWNASKVLQINWFKTFVHVSVYKESLCIICTSVVIL